MQVPMKKTVFKDHLEDHMDALGRNAVHVMTQAFSLSNFNAFQTLHHNQGWLKLGMDDWDVYIGPFAEISLKSLQMCDLVFEIQFPSD